MRDREEDAQNRVKKGGGGVGKGRKKSKKQRRRMKIRTVGRTVGREREGGGAIRLYINR